MSRKPRSTKPAVDASRLCGAADAILQAIHSEQGRRAVVRVLIVQPEAAGAGGYTLAELTEAMSMLLRLGVVESAQPQP